MAALFFAGFRIPLNSFRVFTTGSVLVLVFTFLVFPSGLGLVAAFLVTAFFVFFPNVGAGTTKTSSSITGIFLEVANFFVGYNAFIKLFLSKPVSNFIFIFLS